ncbi:MAG: hypothetical protein ACI82A_000666 [Candidatus Azotimanducaceae bacterium]|jgi:hypothetical protein
MELSNIANIAEIIGTGSIVIGLVFGLIQLQHFRAQQRNAVASSLAQTFYNPTLARAIALLQTLPDDLSLEDLRRQGDEFVDAAVTVTTSFETMGLLVYRRIAPYNLVKDLVGGIVVTMARKLARVQSDLREEQNQPSWAEWFEWLSDQLAREKNHTEPAHVLFKGWRP